MSLAAAIADRGIKEVLHFTTNRGLVGILASGALSRRRLKQEEYLQYILYPNSAVRPEESAFFDEAADWLDYINLSISEINAQFFAVSERWHRESDIWWVIASYDPEIMAHDGVFFATTNNKYELCKRGSGLEGFEALFARVVPRRLPNWNALRGRRPARLPTCQQAEVLYPGQLSNTYLRRIYVRDGQDCDRVRGWVREFRLDHQVEVIIDPAKFQGVPN